MKRKKGTISRKISACILAVQIVVMTVFLVKRTTEDLRNNSNDIKTQLDNVEESVKKLKIAVGQISENVDNVSRIADENQIAVNTIVEMNESTSKIAEEIQRQSEQNKNLAEQLDEVLSSFHVS